MNKSELMVLDLVEDLMVEMKLKDLEECYIQELMVVDFLIYLVKDYKLKLVV